MTRLRKNSQNALAKVFAAHTLPDTVNAWAQIYFRTEVMTSARSRREQRRDLQLFIDFLFQAAGQEHRLAQTPGVSRAFMKHLQGEMTEGGRRWPDCTINRVMAHLH